MARKYFKKKKSYKKKKTSSRGLVRMPRAVNGFPQTMQVNLRYHSGGALTSTSGAISKFQWIANSIFDPDYTATGHQPLFRDEYASIYNHYIVPTSTIIARFTNLSTTAGSLCGIGLDDDTTMTTTPDTAVEQQEGRNGYLTPLGGSRSTITLKKTFNHKKMYGTNPRADLTARTAMTASPTEQSVFNTWVSGFNGATTTAEIEITIYFTVILSELKTPVQS